MKLKTSIVKKKGGKKIKVKVTVKKVKKVKAGGCPLETKARCGTFDNKKCCGKGRFCSAWGWCGTSALHKKWSAQAKYAIDTWGKSVKKTVKKTKKACPPETKSRCGRFDGGKCCGKGRFCSAWGWCGTSALHKRWSSQAKYSVANWK